jgi:hypothetical protein
MKMHGNLARRLSLSIGLMLCLGGSLISQESSIEEIAEPLDSKETAKFQGHVTLVKVPVWGVELKVAGYQRWSDHPGWGQPNFLFAGTSSGRCPLNLSMFVETFVQGGTAEECRKQYKGNPDALSRQRGVTLLENEVRPITYTVFDMEVQGEKSGPGFAYHQLYAYWTRADLCFELHVSSGNCGDFPVTVAPILQSVHLSEDTGATLETVSLAKQSQGDPRDWRLHMAVAGYYLHTAKPNNPSRARRFYLSALKQAPAEIEANDRWLIEEGVGLSWLMQDQGGPALAPLERGLEIARRGGTPPEALPESLYNLGCAHALTGDFEKACGYLESYLGPSGSAGQSSRMSEIQKDKQLKALTKQPCFKKLKDLYKGHPS